VAEAHDNPRPIAAATGLEPPRSAQRRRAALALLLLTPAPTIGTTAAMWVWPGPVGQALYGACKLWLLALPLAWLLLVERGRISLSAPRRGGWGAGLLSGAVVGGAILLAWLLVGRSRVDAGPLLEVARQSGFDQPAVYLGFAAYLALVNALLEEYVWRWFTLRQCERLLGGASAVGAAALFFTLHHVVAIRSFLPWSLTLLASAGVFAGGLLWGALYLRYRSIWPGYVSHVLVDVAVLSVGWMLLFG